MNSHRTRLVVACALSLTITVGTTATPAIGEVIMMPSWREVPSYVMGYGYAGCGPTVGVMIAGAAKQIYGYHNAVAASGPNLCLTTNVSNEVLQMASFMHTTSSGSTLLGDFRTGLEEYFAIEGYDVQANSYAFGSTWDVTAAAFAANLFVALSLDTNGDNQTDHVVLAVGLKDYGDGNKSFYCYNTWNENEVPVEYSYRQKALGVAFGVSASTVITPLSPPDQSPEPATISLLVLGALALGKRRRCPFKSLS